MMYVPVNAFLVEKFGPYVLPKLCPGHAINLIVAGCFKYVHVAIFQSSLYDNTDVVKIASREGSNRFAWKRVVSKQKNVSRIKPLKHANLIHCVVNPGLVDRQLRNINVIL